MIALSSLMTLMRERRAIIIHVTQIAAVTFWRPVDIRT
jgi:hypothetical protein